MNARFLLITALVFFCPKLFSQVGINNTNPNATLDIEASNTATPSNEDGILIPRIDEFPALSPGAAQDGMLVFVTGNGSASEGFYYWDNGTTSWVLVNGSGSDDDWREIGTANAPDDINDNKYSLGRLNIGGTTIPSATLNVRNTNSDDRAAMLIDRELTTTSAGGSKYGLEVSMDVSALNGYIGIASSFLGSTISTPSYGFSSSANNATLDSSFTLYDGVFLGASGSGSLRGLNVFMASNNTNTATKYGADLYIDDALPGTHYGVRSRVLNSSGYAGYFAGRVELGESLSTGRYFMPGTDGTAGQVMTTDGAGNVTFQTAGSDTDWYVQGGTSASTNITDDIYTQGNVAIGNTTSSGTTLYVETDPSVNNTSISSVLSTASAGIVRGIENSATVNGSATAYLNSNYIGGSSSSNGTRAIYNTFVGGGGGTKTGMYNFFTFGFSGNARGVDNNFSNTGIAAAFGLYNNFATTASTAGVSGVYNIASSSLTANTLYGNRTSFIGATVSNEAYGSHNVISTTGTDYGLYARVDNNATDYAAFLAGRVSLGHDPVLNRYFMPGADGTAGQVMTTDGAGNLSFQTFSVAANTLDEAYDEGGAGAGRTITADAGAVTVAGQDGFFVTGAGYGASGTAMPVLGEGARMFFDPSTAAFRAGEVRGDFGSFDDNVWDQGNLGDYSVAMGLNPEATASSSIALGSLASSTSSNAVAIGSNTVASNIGSLALGSGTTASGQYATAAGFASQASGNYSFAIGRQVDAPSYGEVAVGMFPTTYTPSSTTSFVDTDRIFTVANGNVTSVITRSNALTIYKSGLMNINDEYNMPLTDGTVGQVMTTDGSGNVTFQTPSPESTTASNGLTETGDDIRLGGTLTQATTINQDSFNLNFIGASTGNVNIQQTGTIDRALNISKSDNLSGFSYGLYVNKTSSGTGRSHAIYNFVDGTGTGQKYGVFNRINTTAVGSQYGTRNWLSGDTPSSQFGTFNNLDNNGTADVYGVYNGMRVTSASNMYGVYNEFNTANASTTLIAAVRNRLTAGTPGSNGMAGVYTDFDISNNGDLYGNRTEFAGTATGTGNKYGTYNLISSGAGGTHYGTYNEVDVSSGWAGYFVGRNYISDRLSIGETNNANAFLNIRGNSDATVSQIELEQITANTGARIRFKNAAETDHEWVLFARTDDTDADSRFNIFHPGAGNIVQVRGSGQVGINDNDPIYALELPNNTDPTIGRGRANAWITYSDSRVKKNQQELGYGLSEILQITPKSYLQFASEFENGSLILKEGTETREIGFIAQELMEIIPEATYQPENQNEELWSVEYEKIIPVAVNAIKELNTKVESLESENEQLKQQLQQYKSLEARISALEGNNPPQPSETANVTEEK